MLRSIAGSIEEHIEPRKFDKKTEFGSRDRAEQERTTPIVRVCRIGPNPLAGTIITHDQSREGMSFVQRAVLKELRAAKLQDGRRWAIIRACWSRLNQQVAYGRCSWSVME